jgi:hypothetical protein
MSQLREAVIKGRDAFLRELTKPGSLVLYLFIGGTVALVNLIKAYKARSLLRRHRGGSDMASSCSSTGTLDVFEKIKIRVERP